jgi:hypothetical protein
MATKEKKEENVSAFIYGGNGKSGTKRDVPFEAQRESIQVIQLGQYGYQKEWLVVSSILFKNNFYISKHRSDIS